MAAPDLSIVIPSHNGEVHLEHVVRAARAIGGIEVEIIIVDDASRDNSTVMIDRLVATTPNIKAIKLTENGGAGHARNVGFAACTGRYTLFFDADDHLDAAAVETLVALADAEQSDIVVASYTYVRDHSDEIGPMNRIDVELWDTILGGKPHRSFELSDYPRLLETTNYPWNKIARTDRLREINLYFSETKVHNDIHAHWQMLLGARKITLARQSICRHQVAAGNTNLTNIVDRRRLDIFTALNDVETLFDRDEALRAAYYQYFVAFLVVVLTWARQKVSGALLFDYAAGSRDAFSHFTVEDYLRLRSDAPATADAALLWRFDTNRALGI
jgi:glycosyltransferase involved in cell wall biosynthesis